MARGGRRGRASRIRQVPASESGDEPEVCSWFRHRVEDGFPHEGGQFFESLGEFRSPFGAVSIAGNFMRGVVK